MPSRALRLTCALALLAPLAGLPDARAAELGFGVRGGVTGEPDSLFVGGHVTVDGIVPDLEPLTFEPVLSIGRGEEEEGLADLDYTTVRFDANVKYVLSLEETEGVQIYPLAGLALYRVSLEDCDDDAGPGFDCDRTDVGLNLGGGLRWRGFLVDLMAGFDDIPDFTVAVGYTFGR